MVHTLPPWTGKYKASTIYGQVDNGELAARLGSVDVFDRRGNFIFYDDFSSPFEHWVQAGNGVGWAIEVSIEKARIGHHSLVMIAGEGAAGNVTANKYIGGIKAGKIGLEVNNTINANTKEFRLALRYYDGADQHYGYVAYDHDNSKFKYLTTGQVETDLVTGVSLRTTNTPWHTLKMVIDTNTNKYVRFIYNNTEVDMSTLDMFTAASADDAMLQFYFQHESDHASTKRVFIDSVILTQNE